MERLRQHRLLPEPGPLQDPLLELDRGLFEVARQDHVGHEVVGPDLEVGRWAVAGEVDEVDGFGSGEVDGGGPEEEEEEGQVGVNGVVLERWSYLDD